MTDTGELERQVRGLLDRHEITECLFRYTRGLDRLDKELWLSAYHEGAFDNRAPVATTPPEFAEAYWKRDHEGRISQHFLTNIRIDLDGDMAHSESYFLAIIRRVGSDAVTYSQGRYVDRLERRDGRWGIVIRSLIRESRIEVDAKEEGAARHPLSRRDRTDPSYQRPLLPSDVPTPTPKSNRPADSPS
jgi:hypothetical protein